MFYSAANNQNMQQPYVQTQIPATYPPQYQPPNQNQVPMQHPQQQPQQVYAENPPPSYSDKAPIVSAEVV